MYYSLYVDAEEVFIRNTLKAIDKCIKSLMNELLFFKPYYGFIQLKYKFNNTTLFMGKNKDPTNIK